MPKTNTDSQETKTKSENIESTEKVAREFDEYSTSGNQGTTDSSKTGGAEKGGPGIEKAEERQPPGATR